jgi:hypothetical protein
MVWHLWNNKEVKPVNVVSNSCDRTAVHTRIIPVYDFNSFFFLNLIVSVALRTYIMYVLHDVYLT